MSEHLHSTYVDGCYRCDLSRDEAFIAPHACDTGHFDRVVCPEPCGTMHSYCSFCDRLMDHCVLDDEEDQT